MFTQDEIAEIKEYMANTSGKVYIGCDSKKKKIGETWFADYTCVLVVHINDCHGGKIFHYTVRERDYDPKVSKPRMRLMNEVYKAVELYLMFAEELEEREFEIHLDINPHEMHASNLVVKEALGYVQGMCQTKAKIKPEAFAASYAADAGVRGRFS